MYVSGPSLLIPSTDSITEVYLVDRLINNYATSSVSAMYSIVEKGVVASTFS